MGIYVLFIIIAVISYIVQQSFQSKFKKYSQIPLGAPMTGRDIAEKMLHDNGIHDVTVQCTSGMLTDHYNPSNKTVNLSEAVYSSNSIAAAAVAAHECGHAVQHATSYGPLKLRSSLVPIVSFASSWMHWVILAGIIFIEAMPGLLTLGVVMYAATTLFSFITLPVEINASYRAINWLKSNNITYGQSTTYALDALKAAAYTYVVAALSSLATLLYYVMILLGRQRD